MSEKTVSDSLIERRRAWGVRRIVGDSGGGIDGIPGALDEAGVREQPGAQGYAL